MNNLGTASTPEERSSEDQELLRQYHSVEFSINGLNAAYQFKLWNIDSAPMCLLVKEDSHIVSRLKVGEKFKVKYYPTDSHAPPTYLETAICNVVKNDEGRFKGHYLVGLEILGGQQ